MSKYCVVLLLMLFFSVFGYAAVSSTDALNFVQKENHFLSGEESAEINPNVKISYNNADYWVVSVVVESSLNGLIAVKDELPVSIAAGEITQKELFKASYALRSVYSLKRNFSNQWLFNGAVSQGLSSTASVLDNKSTDLEIVKSGLSKYPVLQGEVDSLNQKLVEMKLEFSDAGKNVSETISFESGFFNSPNAGQLNALKKKYLDSLDLIVDLSGKKIAYDNLLNQLQQGIAQADLPVDSKTSLIGLSRSPNELEKISGWALSASNIRQEISNLFDSLPSKVENLYANLLTRIKRNGAYSAINGTDRDILGKGGSFVSVKELSEYVLAKENFSLWKNQAQAVKLKESWASAKNYFDSGKYDLAVEFAKKSKTFALAVYTGGFQAREPAGINNELLFDAAIGLIILLIVLVLIRKRRNLFSFFVKNPEEGDSKPQEVDLNAWKKL